MKNYIDHLKIISNRITVDSRYQKPQIIRKHYEVENDIKLLQHIAKQFYKKDFIVDNGNDKVVELLIKYFNNSPDFETDGNKIYKGLLLVGDVGVGKTFLMKLFRKYANYKVTGNGFLYAHVDDITDAYAIKGIEGILHYTEEQSRKSINGVIKTEPLTLCLDDLGVEKRTVKHYGTEDYVIDNLLNKKYTQFQDKWVKTHAISNLDPDQLRKRYGRRLASRFKEMFNYIVLDGKNRRH